MQQNITKLLGEKVPDRLIKTLWGANINQFLMRQSELVVIANLIQKLYKTYITKNKLKKIEQRQIAKDAARRLLQFTLPNFKQWSVGAAQVLMQALCLNWRVLHRSHIKTIAHNLVKPVFQGKR